MRRGRPIAPLTLTQEEQATLEQREISGDRIFHFLFNLPPATLVAAQCRTDYLL